MPASIQVDTAKCRSPCQLNRFAPQTSNNGKNARLIRLSWPRYPPRAFAKINCPAFENFDFTFHAFSIAVSWPDSGTFRTPAVLFGALPGGRAALAPRP